MTMATNAFSTFAAKGIREDLSNIIYNISPTETPFVTNIGKRTARNTFFEWQTDSLAAAVTTNAQLEGDDVSATAVTPTTRVGNYTQISRKQWTITGTLEAVDKAGRKTEQAYQMAKQGKELKRDVEATLTSSQVAVSGGTTTARQTAAFDSWLTSNVDNGAGGGGYTYTTTPVTARTTGTARNYTENLLKSNIKSTWTSGGSLNMLMVGPVNKQRVSGFAGIADIRTEVKGKSTGVIVGAADVYVSDFGSIDVVPNRFMPEDRAYLIDPDYVALATLRPYQASQLAKTGDAEKWMMLVEYGLEVNNQAAHGVVRDLTTT